MKSKRFFAVIEGRVQGVGFRYFTKEIAQQLGINGWVKNTHSGSVEVVAEGSAEAIETFIQRLKQGPQSSFVTEFKITWQEPTSEFRKFSIKLSF